MALMGDLMKEHKKLHVSKVYKFCNIGGMREKFILGG